MPAQRVRVMLSSRNRDLLPAQAGGTAALEDIRKTLKSELEDTEFLGTRPVEVWINEEAGAEDGTTDSWDKCLAEVDGADIVIVIYNGEAGWAGGTEGLGICHAEFLRALSQAPARLRVIELDFPSAGGARSPKDTQQATDRNKAFAADMDRASTWRVKARNDESLKREVRKAVAKGVIELAKTGSREARRGRFHLGAPLDWSRFTFRERRDALVSAVSEFLESSMQASKLGDGHSLAIQGESILLKVSGVPAGMGTPEAREMVGRPYLDDHISLENRNVVGPLHVIACHKTCSESHVVSFMGHPDQYLVETPFGIFAADRRTFVQAAFIAQCRDESSTKLGCQRLFDWLQQSGEMGGLLARGRSRAKLMSVVANEIKAHGTTARPSSRAKARGRRR
jgi:hypothetical protein